MWQVFLYIAILVPFLMLQRVKFCLLITYIYTYYLAYIIYWGDFIMSADTCWESFKSALLKHQKCTLLRSSALTSCSPTSLS